MPSTSKKQHNLMAAVANNPKFAKKVGIAQSVGKDFINANKGKKFKEGGEMKEKKMARGGKSGPAMPAAIMAQIAKSGIPRRMRPTQDVEAPVAPMMPQPPQPAAPMRKGGKVKKMAKGGPTMDASIEKGEKSTGHGEHSVQERGKTKGTIIKMAKGGFVKAADGIAQRGKTKGKLC